MSAGDVDNVAVAIDGLANEMGNMGSIEL